MNSEKRVLSVIVNGVDSINTKSCGCDVYIIFWSLNRSRGCRVGYTEEAEHEKVGKPNHTCSQENPGYENSDC